MQALAEKLNVKVIHKGGGHVQFVGKLTVNYYPDSRKRTAYIKGTKKGIHNISFNMAMKMANRVPPIKVNRNGRKHHKELKKQLLLKKPFCEWCNCKLEQETATLEHVIPLGRGGLDNPNNITLACKPCNDERGNNMPEMEEDRE